MRLDKFISESTPYSRKEIKALIKSGVVFVDGVAAKRPEESVNEACSVTINGEVISYKKFIYLLMNKPAGYVSATFDKHDPVVVDLLPEEYLHFEPYPVGRLDIDTVGLLLLTNDGDFAHRVITPKKDVVKTYYTECDGAFASSDAEAFKAGMEFKDFTAKSATLEILDDATTALISISEGKFHQVKRMCERVGKTVTYLKRVSIGGLMLPADLPEGECIELSIDELNRKIFEIEN